MLLTLILIYLFLTTVDIKPLAFAYITLICIWFICLCLCIFSSIFWIANSILICFNITLGKCLWGFAFLHFCPEALPQKAIFLSKLVLTQMQRISRNREEDEKQKKKKKPPFPLYNLILDFLTETYGPYQTLQMQFLWHLSHLIHIQYVHLEKIGPKKKKTRINLEGDGDGPLALLSRTERTDPVSHRQLDVTRDSRRLRSHQSWPGASGSTQLHGPAHLAWLT